jgi:hypothetical protein
MQYRSNSIQIIAYRRPWRRKKGAEFSVHVGAPTQEISVSRLLRCNPKV